MQHQNYYFSNGRRCVFAFSRSSNTTGHSPSTECRRLKRFWTEAIWFARITSSVGLQENFPCFAKRLFDTKTHMYRVRRSITTTCFGDRAIKFWNETATGPRIVFSSFSPKWIPQYNVSMSKSIRRTDIFFDQTESFLKRDFAVSQNKFVAPRELC